MNIKFSEIIILEIRKNELKIDAPREGDLIMYRGDTYQVIEVNFLVINQIFILKLVRLYRALNFFTINKKDELNIVADFNLNCLDDKTNKRYGN